MKESSGEVILGFSVQFVMNAKYGGLSPRPLQEDCWYQSHGWHRPSKATQSFLWSSRPGEFHPQSLTEPNVKVSLHSALVIQSWARAQSASGRIDSAYW